MQMRYTRTLITAKCLPEVTSATQQLSRSIYAINCGHVIRLKEFAHSVSRSAPVVMNSSKIILFVIISLPTAIRLYRMTNTSRFNVYQHTIQLAPTPTAVKDMTDVFLQCTRMITTSVP